MNHEFADGYSRSTAFGAKLIETLRAGTWTAVSGDVCRTHWGREHTVTERHFAQLNGTCKMGVFVIFHDISICYMTVQKYDKASKIQNKNRFLFPSGNNFGKANKLRLANIM
jgi:hypothetical protein